MDLPEMHMIPHLALSSTPQCKTSDPSAVEAANLLEPDEDGERYLVAAGLLLSLLASADGAESMQIDGVSAVVSGIGSNSENGIVGCLNPGADRKEKITALMEFVRRHNVPASWLLVRRPAVGDNLADACRAVAKLGLRRIAPAAEPLVLPAY
jgi:hypothetical protein